MTNRNLWALYDCFEEGHVLDHEVAAELHDILVDDARSKMEKSIAGMIFEKAWRGTIRPN